jgi:PEP-CTERM motif
MKHCRLVFLAVCLAGLAQPLWADPILLGAGGPGINNHVSVSGANLFVFSFDFDHTRVVASDFIPLNVNPNCPCPVGSSVDLNSHFAGSINGLAVVNGVAYSGVNFLFDFNFTVPGMATVVPPQFGLEPGPNFTFTGTLSGTQNGQSLVAPVSLVGSGTTQFSPNPVLNDPTNRPVRLLFSFTEPGSGASPTPEPASVMLLASGLAVALRRRLSASV